MMKKIRYIISLLIIFMMLLAADIGGGRSMVVLDAGMLVFGLLCTDRLPWKTDRLHAIILIAAAAFGGTAIQALMPGPVYFKILAAFAFAGILVVLTDCKFMSVFSVCLAPVMFGNSSVSYPVMATAVIFAVCIAWHVLVRIGAKEEAIKFRYLPDFERDMRIWLVMIIAMAVMAVYPAWWNKLAYIYPPIITIFTEGCYRDLKGKRLRILFVTVVSAVAGAMTEFFLSGIFGIPMCISAMIAVGITMLEMRLMSMPFAPICSVALVPFAVDVDFFEFPIMTAIGCTVILIVSAIINSRLRNSKGKGKHAVKYHGDME